MFLRRHFKKQFETFKKQLELEIMLTQILYLDELRNHLLYL